MNRSIRPLLTWALVSVLHLPHPASATLFLELEIPASCIQTMNLQTANNEPLQALFERLASPGAETLNQEGGRLNALEVHRNRRRGSAPGTLPDAAAGLAPYVANNWKSLQDKLAQANAFPDGVITIEIPNQEVWVGTAEQFAALPEVLEHRISARHVYAHSMTAEIARIYQAREVEMKMRAILERDRVIVSNRAQASYMKQILSKWFLAVERLEKEIVAELEDIRRLAPNETGLMLSSAQRAKLGTRNAPLAEFMLQQGSVKGFAFSAVPTSGYSKEDLFNNRDFVTYLMEMAEHSHYRSELDMTSMIRQFAVVNVADRVLVLEDQLKIYTPVREQLQQQLKEIDLAERFFTLKELL